MPTMHVPYVIERSSRGERSYDVFSRLLMDRVVFVGTEIDDDVANAVIAQLLVLDADAPGKEIAMYINSPGGSVSSGFAIYDTMQYLRSPVSTTCVGMAASMGCFLLAGGAPGKRGALPNSRIMMHQPHGGGVRGNASDIEIVAREFLHARKQMYGLLARHTGQPLERIERDFDRDFFMSAPEARAYGVIDRVIGAGEGVEGTLGAAAGAGAEAAVAVG